MKIYIRIPCFCRKYRYLFNYSIIKLLNSQIDEYSEEKERLFDILYDFAAQFEEKEPEEITELQREEVRE